MVEALEGGHQEVQVGNGRIIVTEEGIVFSGGKIPILADPVEELRAALDEIEKLREQLPNEAGISGSFDGITDTRKVTVPIGEYNDWLVQRDQLQEAIRRAIPWVRYEPARQRLLRALEPRDKAHAD